MSKKLEANGLFESSRMMLPEHKEAYVRHQQQLQKKKRPQLDEHELEHLSGLIAESLQYSQEITLVLYGEFESLEYTGVVTKIDQQNRMLRLAQASDPYGMWIKVEDIMSGVLK